MASRHLPPNSARTGYATEWTLFIFTQLSTEWTLFIFTQLSTEWTLFIFTQLSAEWTLFIFTQLSTDAVSALWKVRGLSRLWKQHSVKSAHLNTRCVCSG